MKKITNWQAATVADIEADNLLKEATKIHVLSYQMQGKEVKSIDKERQYDRIRKFFQHHIDKGIPLVMHNGIGYDVPLVEKLLGMDLSKLMLIDTLALSWYLNFNRKSHGLDSFHADYGIEKPKIDDWENLTFEDYLFRCQEDVKINTALWEDFKNRLVEIYSSAKGAIDSQEVGGKRMSDGEVIKADEYVGLEVEEHIDRILTFLMFKMDCIRLQEKTRICVDVDYLNETREELEERIEEAKAELEGVMPKVPQYAPRKRPAKPYKKNGELSKSGESWQKVVEDIAENRKDEGGNLLAIKVDEDSAKVLKGYSEPNINSVSQIKSFLFSHGWKPRSFTFDRDNEAFQKWIDSKPVEGSHRKQWSLWKERKPKDRAIPQISIQGDDGKELCPSVVEMAEEIPEIMAYSKYTTIKHRLDTVKGFLASIEDEKYIVAGVGGFTNTLRMKHRAPVVNLPGVDKPYGENIRGALVADKGYVLLGSDLSSLEDRTKHHFMLPYDPEYVETMMEDDFDPHILMALSAGMITQEEYEAFKRGEKPDHVAKARKAGKSTNYASVYNAGPPTIARAAGVSEEEGKTLHEGYWKLNWAVKAVAEDQYVFEDSRDSKWLVNPINGFCYSLRKESDRFSTLAQGSGAFIFDMWLNNIQESLKEVYGTERLSLQAHDEYVVSLRDKESTRSMLEKITQEALEKVNKEFYLRRAMGCDVQFGKRYSDIH